VYKNGIGFDVIKETSTQSILTDLATCFVFIVLFACGIAFELFVGRSWLIEFLVMLLIFVFIFGRAGRMKKKITKEELIKMIEKL
jgi:hypothetical protein